MVHSIHGICPAVRAKASHVCRREVRLDGTRTQSENKGHGTKEVLRVLVA